MISRGGIEGGAVYALSRFIRDEPGQQLAVDLRPDLTADVVNERLSRRNRKDSRSNVLRKAFGLSPAAIALLRETGAQDIKAVPIAVGPPAGVERAISSAGGIALSEVNAWAQKQHRVASVYELDSKAASQLVDHLKAA